MPSILTLADTDAAAAAQLLAKYGIQLCGVDSGVEIPGSYWGEREAGLVGNTLYARADTPLHSLLHEACHFICMDEDRREMLYRDAGGDYDEENAVCYLQIVLGDYLAACSSMRVMQDMDAWGYTFRLGSARAWFECDASEARCWLIREGLLDQAGTPTWKLRKGGASARPFTNVLV